ncbi:hypothetical protein EDD11_010502 [Mortierella claussenii]|nr:hypothetical protein EDD11_010502 [Mortierella claussenii]
MVVSILCRVLRLYICRRKADPVRDCIEVASGMGVNIIRVTKHELNELSDQRPHQGIVLETSKLSQRFVTSLGPVSTTNQYSAHGPDAKYNFRRREDEPPVWIALDEVVDPQNLGAIMRSAFFLGVDGVIVCHKNSAPLSAVVSKASAGALEMRSTYGVTSLARFLQASESKKNGWHVVGAHASQTSMRNRPLHLWPETGVDQPTLLVMGSEGNGLRKHVMEQCDTFIQIPTINSIASNVDSLNVSVATGIILSKLMGGRFLHLPKNLKKYPDRYHQAELAAAKLVWASKKDEEFKEDEYADKEDHDDDNDHSDDADDEQEQNVVTKFKSTNKNASKNDNLPF